MTDAEIRTRVKARLADGSLPRQITVAALPLKQPGNRSPEAFTIGNSLPDRCAVCDEAATQFRYNQQNVAFHERCRTIWQEEASKVTRRE